MAVAAEELDGDPTTLLCDSKEQAADKPLVSVMLFGSGSHCFARLPVCMCFINITSNALHSVIIVGSLCTV